VNELFRGSLELRQPTGTRSCGAERLEPRFGDASVDELPRDVVRQRLARRAASDTARAKTAVRWLMLDSAFFYV